MKPGRFGRYKGIFSHCLFYRERFNMSKHDFIAELMKVLAADQDGRVPFVVPEVL
jgi:hypothetical protein